MKCRLLKSVLLLVLAVSMTSCAIEGYADPYGGTVEISPAIPVGIDPTPPVVVVPTPSLAAANQDITVGEGQSFTGGLIASGSCSGSYYFDIYRSPVRGTVTLISHHTGSFAYSADPFQIGADGFDFSVSDGCSTQFGHVEIHLVP